MVALVSRFENELRASVSLGEAAFEEGEGTVLRCYQVQYLELETIGAAVTDADLLEGVSLLGLACGHTERGRRFASVKLAGEPEQILACMRRLHGLVLRQGDRTFTRLRWSPLPQDSSPVGVALAKARLRAGERVAFGFGQGAASMFPVAEWAWRSTASLLRGEEGGEEASAEVELAGMAAAAGWAQWQSTPATPLTQHTPAVSGVGTGGRGGGREGGGRGGGRGVGGLPRVPESPEAGMVSRQLFGEQLAGMSGGEISSLEELLAAARAGKAAAAELPGLRATVQQHAVAQEELRERQTAQAEELALLREERQEMKGLLTSNQRVLEGQIRAAQAASQPMLRAIMAKLGIALEEEKGGRDRPMEVEERATGGSEAGAAGPSAAVSAGAGNGQAGGGALVVSEQVQATAQGGAAGMAPRGVVAVASGAVTATGERGQQREALGGLDHLVATQRRAEVAVERSQARVEALRQAEREAKEAEARALEAEEEAREALESRVPDGGEGEDMQEAFFQAKEATERASGDLAARRAQRRAAEEALGRVQEELRRAGEDTRPLADKRKRREQSEGGRELGKEEQAEA